MKIVKEEVHTNNIGLEGYVFYGVTTYFDNGEVVYVRYPIVHELDDGSLLILEKSL